MLRKAQHGGNADAYYSSIRLITGVQCTQVSKFLKSEYKYFLHPRSRLMMPITASFGSEGGLRNLRGGARTSGTAAESPPRRLLIAPGQLSLACYSAQQSTDTLGLESRTHETSQSRSSRLLRLAGLIVA